MSVSTESATKPASRRVLHVGSVGLLIAGVLAVIGSSTPWVITPAGSLSGMSGPGLWVLSAGFIGIAGALLPHRRIAIGHALLAGLGLAFVSGWQLVRLLQLSIQSGSWGSLFPGIGLVLAAGAAALTLRTCYRMIRSPG